MLGAIMIIWSMYNTRDFEVLIIPSAQECEGLAYQINMDQQGKHRAKCIYVGKN